MIPASFVLPVAWLRSRCRVCYGNRLIADSDPAYRRRRPRWLALIAGLVLSGCSGGETPLDQYLDRLGRSLERDIEYETSPVMPLPRARKLGIALESASIDILDMFTLRDCRLAVTIGQSNSSLGKVAPASQRLLLELEFLALAPQCIAGLQRRGEDSLAATLQTALLEKQRQLPARIWNATLGGPEFRAFWRSSGNRRNYPDGVGGAVPAALVELSGLVDGWLAGQYDIGTGRLEALLELVRRGDGGVLLAALAGQQQGLAMANRVVRARLRDPALCPGGTPTPKGRIFDTVVRKFFIGKVQPVAVQLDRRSELLGAPVRALEAALDTVIPDAYRPWRAQRDRILASSDRAPRQHALAVAELLDSCGLRPGGNRN